MTPLGSNRDRHANLGDGEIGREGCAAFLSEPRFEGLPCVLEGPGAAGKAVEPSDMTAAFALRDEGLAARKGRGRRSGAEGARRAKRAKAPTPGGPRSAPARRLTTGGRRARPRQEVIRGRAITAFQSVAPPDGAASRRTGDVAPGARDGAPSRERFADRTRSDPPQGDRAFGRRS